MQDIGDVVVYMTNSPSLYEEKDSVFFVLVAFLLTRSPVLACEWPICVHVCFSLAGVTSSKGIYIYIRKKKFNVDQSLCLGPRK